MLLVAAKCQDVISCKRLKCHYCNNGYLEHLTCTTTRPKCLQTDIDNKDSMHTRMHVYTHTHTHTHMMHVHTRTHTQTCMHTSVSQGSGTEEKVFEMIKASRKT